METTSSGCLLNKWGVLVMIRLSMEQTKLKQVSHTQRDKICKSNIMN
jgi:hypothetical protein